MALTELEQRPSSIVKLVKDVPLYLNTPSVKVVNQIFPESSKNPFVVTSPAPYLIGSLLTSLGSFPCPLQEDAKVKIVTNKKVCK